MNHPAGRIGKRLILRVRDVMLTGSSLPLIGPDVFIMEVRQSHNITLCHTVFDIWCDSWLLSFAHPLRWDQQYAQDGCVRLA